MKKIRVFTFLLIVSLLSLLIPIDLVVSAPNDTTQEINFDFATEPSDYEYSGYIFSAKKELETKSITVNAPAGKIIKKLEWVSKSTNTPIRSINGFTPGLTTWKGKDKLSGTKLKVRSRDNSNYGGVYYWDRWSVNDAGNGYGQIWKASSTTGLIMDNKDPRCNVNVEKETIHGRQLPKYPGCTDPKLEAKINRSEAFLIEEPGNSLHRTWIRSGAISNEVTASNTRIDFMTDIPDVHGTTGRTDPSTLGGEVARVENNNSELDVIIINFSQTFNNDTYNRYWANPKSKQVWYFSKFFVDFDSYTYMYKDKLLRATFADGTSGLEITGPTCVAPSGTIQLTATLTKVDGSTYNLQKHDKLTWRSSDSSIMSINDSGAVTAVAATGGATITAHFKDAAQALDESADVKIQVGTGSSCGNTGGGPGNPPSTCGIQIGAARKGTVTSHTVMDPVATGVIKADQRDSEQFNVLDGIPTSETLYVNVFGLNYLYQNQWANMSGEITYTVPVKKKYILTWTIPGTPSSGPNDPGTPDKPMREEVPVEERLAIIRPYSYWQIDNLEVYKLGRSTVSNYALPGGSVSLTPTGYTPPILTSDHSARVEDHVKASPCEEVDLGTETVPGGSSRPVVPSTDFTSAAESAVGQNQVKNDKVLFNGSTVMSDSWAQEAAPIPGIIPPASTINRDVLYGKNYLISSTLLNKKNTPSTGTIEYDLIPGNINGGSPKSYPVNAINTVTVHTPVVNYSSVTDDQDHNQKTTPNSSRSAFILDRPFTVTTGVWRSGLCKICTIETGVFSFRCIQQR
ncbi:DUF5704 domain-containing protein [Paenibacillus solani]|uniref:DUF5704 domain-containing protein n=1 Tax=Paenibacillus solani TaxID=1705565 RepID=UPI003D270B1E